MASTQIPFRRRHAMYVAKLKRNATVAENEFCRCLTSLGLDYRFQQGFYHPLCRIADFFIPSLNLVVEIDGPCHDADQDQRKDIWFEQVRGIKTLRLTNEQVLSGQIPDFSSYAYLYVPTPTECGK